MTVMAIATMLPVSALLAGMLLPAAELPVLCRFVSPLVVISRVALHRAVRQDAPAWPVLSMPVRSIDGARDSSRRPSPRTPRLQRLVTPDVQRMARRPVGRRAKAERPPPAVGRQVVVGRTDRILHEPERGRVSRPVGEQVDDLQEPAALPPGKSPAPPNRRVILAGVCGAGVSITNSAARWPSPTRRPSR